MYLYKNAVAVFNIAVSTNDRMNMNIKIPTEKKIGRDVI
jgi:hypothetical protein